MGTFQTQEICHHGADKRLARSPSPQTKPRPAWPLSFSSDRSPALPPHSFNTEARPSLTTPLHGTSPEARPLVPDHHRTSARSSSAAPAAEGFLPLKRGPHPVALRQAESAVSTEQTKPGPDSVGESAALPQVAPGSA